MALVVELIKQANVFEKYGVNKYMNAFGLSVNPKYRGASLGAHLLSARYKSSTILFDVFQYLPFVSSVLVTAFDVCNSFSIHYFVV